MNKESQKTLFERRLKEAGIYEEIVGNKYNTIKNKIKNVVGKITGKIWRWVKVFLFLLCCAVVWLMCVVMSVFVYLISKTVDTEMVLYIGDTLREADSDTWVSIYNCKFN